MYPNWPTWEDFERFLTQIEVPSKHPFLEDEALFSFYAPAVKSELPNAQKKILFVAGLGACTLGWRLTARYLQEKTGYSVYCLAMPGHDGTWKSLQDTTLATWVNGVAAYIEQEQLHGCYCVAHSSGSLPCLLLQAQNPKCFSRIMAIGVPFFLRRPCFHAKVASAQFLHALIRSIPGVRYELLQNMKIPTGKSLAPLGDEIERVNVCYSFMPGTVLRTLKDAVDSTTQKLPALDPSCLHFFQGEHDLVVNRERCRRFYQKQRLAFHEIPNAPHAAHVSRQWQVLADTLHSFM